MSRWRPVLRWGSAVPVAAVLGVGSAGAIMLSGLAGSDDVSVGAWSINLDRGSPDAGPYVRSATAVQALLAMTREEAVYFVAAHDDEGRRLTERCEYEVRGAEYPAAWWSITLYDGAWLADNDDDHPSIDATSVQLEPGRTWAARLAATPGTGGNWISMRDADDPNLLFPLYVPDQSVLDDPASVRVPSIRRISCRGRS